MTDHPVLLAIDPGPELSAWVVLNPHSDGIRQAGVSLNPELLDRIRHSLGRNVAAVVIEKVEGFGMPVGAEVFETVYWTGRFAEAAANQPDRPAPTIDRISRKTVKIHLCGSLRAKDPNIRQALIDRYGGPAAIGRKASPGPLYGIAKDVWSALAVAVTYADQQNVVTVDGVPA